LSSSQLFSDEEENIYLSATGLSVYSQDTIEREQSVENVQQQELNAQIQAQLIELAHDAIIVRDPASKIVSWNKGAERLYGWTAQEAVGQVIHELLQTRFLESREEIDDVLATGECWEGELVHIRKDGSQVIVESRQVVTRNQQNLPIAILEVNRNITRRKQRERETEKDLLRLAAIVADSDDAIVSKTLDGIINSWNRSAEKMFGYTAQEAIGKHIYLIIPEELRDEENDILRRLRNGEHIDHFETQRMHKDGTRIDVSLSISPIKNKEGWIIGASKIARDITERKQIQRRFEQRKDEFISMTSHELKTPVTSLKGFAHVLQRRMTRQGDEQGLHYLSRINAQLDKLIKIISDLLDISRMQTGQLVFRNEVFDLDKLIYETVENVQVATTTHQFLVEGSTQACVIGDKDRLSQVFINLFTNAVKYSPKAGKVIVRLSQEQEMVIVSVQDFGIGIDPSYHQKIFERFYQVTDPEERTYPGLGIGLYISRQIIEQHHGQISVQSRKGEGSTFSVALPLYKKESEQESLP